MKPECVKQLESLILNWPQVSTDEWLRWTYATKILLQTMSVLSQEIEDFSTESDGILGMLQMIENHGEQEVRPIMEAVERHYIPVLKAKLQAYSDAFGWEHGLLDSLALETDEDEYNPTQREELSSVVEGVLKAGMANVLNVASRANAVDRCNAAMREHLTDKNKAGMKLVEWEKLLQQSKKTIVQTDAWRIDIPKMKSENEAIQRGKAIALNGEIVSEKVS